LYTNPADHILDVITPSKLIEDESVLLKEQSLIDASILAVQKPVATDRSLGANKRADQLINLPANPHWLKQIWIL